MNLSEKDVLRFWSKVDKGNDMNDCWLWRGTLVKGYGMFSIKGKNVLAHRISYQFTNESVDNSLELDHLCRIRKCVNPKYLEQVTHKENVLRGHSPMAISLRFGCCKRGHPFNMQNTRILKSRNSKECRICERDRKRMRRKRFLN